MLAIKPRAIRDFILVAGAAIALGLLGPRAQAGSLDQGPHMLITLADNVRVLAVFPDKDTCLSVRDDVLKHVTQVQSERTAWNQARLLVCVPGTTT